MVKQTMEKERITPTVAERFLNANKGNRSLRAGVVEKYALDMEQGNWTDCIDPIAFYDDGDIADGQHRLYAIIESGKAFEFWVLRGVPRVAGLNIDTGLGRTIVDNAAISGLDKTLSNTLVALARFYDIGGWRKEGMSNAERLACVNKHRDVCVWAVQNGPSGRGFRNAVVLAAVARAYAHGADPDRLIQFSKMLNTGISNGNEDSAAIAFRNYIMARHFRVNSGEAHDVFLKCQNAIWYFLRHKPLQTIKRVGEEIYPLKVPKKGGGK